MNTKRASKRVVARRSYRQGARAEAAEETARRILDAFLVRLRGGWFEDIRLDDVAADAGVTVQTVIRRFGGKGGLLEAAMTRMGGEIERRRGQSIDREEIFAALIEDYEAVGDLILRLLAQEERWPAIRAVTDRGRAFHRAWVEQAFARDLAAARQRRDLVDALVVATDLYTWKLIRRDMRRSLKAARSAMRRLAEGAFAEFSKEISR